MNKLIKIITISSLTMCALFVWISLAIIGFMSCFVGNMAWLRDITPMIGVVCVTCIIYTIRSIYKSNPVNYVSDLFKVKA